ncbi:MAG: flagellar motor switch protein FliG [Thermaerobacter sp.]|nr:flagellar motor switch protein FliG [Thermaerobacter sp.]
MVELTGRRKAAILISGLGPEIAAQVYKHLGEQEIEQVTVELARAETSRSEERLAVLEEFRDMREANTFIDEGGISYARTILEKALGVTRAKDILERLTTSLAPRPFDSMRNADPMQLLTFLQGEHPQTIALVLAYIRADAAAAVLKSLPPELQADVARRIATMERTNPTIVAEVEAMLEGKMVSLFGGDLSQPGGVDVMVQVLSQVDRSTERTILQSLEDKNPELADEIRRRMFLFEDFALIDDRFIQRIIREVDQQDLVLALKGASDSISQKFYTNMSSRMAEVVREDLKFLGAVRLRDVESAQQRIVSIARRLEEEGEIIMSSGGQDEIIA